LLFDLRRTPPAMIIVERGDRFRWVTGDVLDSAQALSDFAELRHLIDSRYRHAGTVEDFDLYEKRPGR
jgi:hypothetical protein